MVGMLRVVIYLIAVQLEQFFWSLQRTWKKKFFFSLYQIYFKKQQTEINH